MEIRSHAAQRTLALEAAAATATACAAADANAAPGDVSIGVSLAVGAIGDVVIRSLQPGDIEQLKLLHSQLFPVRYNSGFFASLLLEPRLSLVATRGDTIVGVVTSRIAKRYNCSHGAFNVGYISTLGVLPQHRRKRIGSRLLQAVVEVLREYGKCDAVDLHVMVDNEGALNMYKAENFKVVQFLRSHYFFHNRNHDALLLRLSFNGDVGNAYGTGIWSLVGNKCTIL